MCVLTSFKGFETTNNGLAYVSYLLALHPVEQEKVYNEITDFYSTKPVSYYQCKELVSVKDKNYVVAKSDLVT